MPLFWRVDLPDVLKVLSQRGVLPKNFLPVVKPHLEPFIEVTNYPYIELYIM